MVECTRGTGVRSGDKPLRDVGLWTWWRWWRGEMGKAEVFVEMEACAPVGDGK